MRSVVRGPTLNAMLAVALEIRYCVLNLFTNDCELSDGQLNVTNIRGTYHLVEIPFPSATVFDDETLISP